MGMTYHCHGCFENVRSKDGKCPKCGLREDVDEIINLMPLWKENHGLTRDARDRIIKIIELGLDSDHWTEDES